MNEVANYLNYSFLKDGVMDIREVSVEDIEFKIKEFLQMKFNIASIDKNLYDILLFLERTINKEELDNVLNNMIFHILSYMSILQEYEIVWFIEEVDVTYFEESKYELEKLGSLVTNEEFNAVEVLNYCLMEAKKLKNKGLRK